MAEDPVKRRRAARGSNLAGARLGFTLIEVMISIVLTGLAMMGVIALYVTETRASSYSRHATEAAVLAEDKVEKLRTLIAQTYTATAESSLNDRGSNNPPGIYLRTYSETLTGAYADILVTVQWDDDGILHTVTVRARRNQ